MCLDHILLQTAVSFRSEPGPWWVPHESHSSPASGGLQCHPVAGGSWVLRRVPTGGLSLGPWSRLPLTPTHPAVLSHWHCSRRGKWLTSVTCHQRPVG